MLRRSGTTCLPPRGWVGDDRWPRGLWQFMCEALRARTPADSPDFDKKHVPLWGGFRIEVVPLRGQFRMRTFASPIRSTAWATGPAHQNWQGERTAEFVFAQQSVAAFRVSFTSQIGCKALQSQAACCGTQAASSRSSDGPGGTGGLALNGDAGNFRSGGSCLFSWPVDGPRWRTPMARDGGHCQQLGRTARLPQAQASQSFNVQSFNGSCCAGRS